MPFIYKVIVRNREHDTVYTEFLFKEFPTSEKLIILLKDKIERNAFLRDSNYEPGGVENIRWGHLDDIRIRWDGLENDMLMNGWTGRGDNYSQYIYIYIAERELD